MIGYILLGIAMTKRRPCLAGPAYSSRWALQRISSPPAYPSWLARNAGDGSAQVDLDYVVPRYQGFTLGEFAYRPGGPLAAPGYRRVIAPPRMQNGGDYLTDVGFRPEGDAMVLDLA